MGLTEVEKIEPVENKLEVVLDTESDPKEINNEVDLDTFIADGEKIAKPIYDIEKQEILDNRILLGINEFYNNNYENAEEIFSKYLCDPLHCLGSCALKYMKALVTFDKDEISTTIKELDKTERIASKQLDRIISDEKKMGSNPNFITKMYKKKDKKTINNAKLRAIIIRAECNLLAASLYLFQENMVGFVKAALRLKKVWSGYSTCWSAIKDNLEESRKQMDRHTFNGVLFGVGASKLLISVLPTKILHVIAVLGVTSDRDGGLKLLNRCIEDKNLYSPMALSAQLFYFSIYNSLSPSTAKDSLEEGQRLINIGLKMYPNSAIQQYFEGRFIRLIRDLDSSTKAFNNSNNAQNHWKELNNLCLYELSLNSIFDLDWELSIEHYEILIKEKYYSEIFFLYLIGILYYLKGDLEKTKEYFNLSKKAFNDKQKQEKVIEIEEYSQKMIKHIEMDAYTDIEIALFEFLYLWDGLPSMSPQKLETLLGMVNKSLDKKINPNPEEAALKVNLNTKRENEKKCLLYLVKGSILRELGRTKESEAELCQVFKLEHLISKKSFTLPFTCFEFSLLYWTTKDYTNAQKYLSKAKNYKGYFLEFRLDIKILRITECIKNDSK